MMHKAILKYLQVTISILVFALLTPKALKAAPPANFQTTPIINTGLDAPSGFEFAPDGRIFILQRTGEVLIYKNGQLLPQPFAVLPSSNTGDRGLIGIVFDPNYFSNHYVYFYYNSSADLLNYLVRYDASGDVGTNGPVIIYHTNIPSEYLHQGGGLAFGPDGKIYLGVGDNGYHPNAQDLSNPHGKILRINADGTIPSDNPFFGQPGKLPEIWAYGFRNPWRLSFDSANGRISVSEVGEATYEEINRVIKGGNYGWPIAEGICTANCTGLIDPIYSYPHNGGSAAATGGPVYHGSMFPSQYQGVYFFGDYSLGFLKYLTLDSNGNSTGVNTFDPSVGSIVDLKVGTDGSLYYLTIFPAGLFQTIYTTGNKVPVAVASANVTSGLEPLTVNFSSSGTNDPNGDPLTYSWTFGDGTTSTAPNPVKTYSIKGRYIAQLTVSDGTYTVLSNPIVVQVGKPPTITIVSPSNNANYKDGDTINFSANAVDGSGNTLTSSAFTTNVYFHHQTHIHPFLGPLNTNSGSFITPTTGESSPDVYFEIIFTVEDQYGLITTASTSIFPQKVNLTLNSSPTNLSILLDGIPTTPQTIQQVVGFEREVRPLLWQAVGGTYYQFDHWSDGGGTVHTITIPNSNSTLTAFYTPQSAFTGQYYNNTSLSGSPSFTRQDPIINFNWGGTSPGSPLSINNYSVRWTNNVNFGAGKYVFTTTSDDGVRLYIDGNLVIDKWFDQGTSIYTYTTDLTSGNHIIVMEYYQAFGGAIAKLTWDLTPNQAPVTPTPTPTPTSNPTPTPTVPPGSGQLLTSPWHLSGNNSSSEAYQTISPTALQGATSLSLTYDIHGTCILGGDASAIIFDQGGSWHYVSLSNYGQNCYDGTQTVNIPLSDFPGLIPSASVGTFHTRFWFGSSFAVDITSAVVNSASVTPTPTPTPTSITPTPPPSKTELLTNPWHLTATNASAESYQTVPPNILNGNTSLELTYNLHGLCALGGDASAIIFDQGGSWHYISLSNYGTNCLNGSQTVIIPLSDFPSLNTAATVGTFHTRFWYSGSFTVDITSAKVFNNSVTPTPTPTPPSGGGTQLLTNAWHLTTSSGSAEGYQSIPSNVLNGKTNITLTYNLNGLCALGGDASAIIFDQGGSWRYISLSDYGSNCYFGTQTVTIPLSAFAGLNPALPVSSFHTRFWYPISYTVDITSAIVN